MNIRIFGCEILESGFGNCSVITQYQSACFCKGLARFRGCWLYLILLQEVVSISSNQQKANAFWFFNQLNHPVYCWPTNALLNCWKNSETFANRWSVVGSRSPLVGGWKLFVNSDWDENNQTINQTSSAALAVKPKQIRKPADCETEKFIILRTLHFSRESLPLVSILRCLVSSLEFTWQRW